MSGATSAARMGGYGLLGALAATASALAAATGPVATFSVVAADPASGEVGVAVASKFFAVGSVVPWARAGVGAVATQSYANTTYGPRGLDLLAQGLGPQEVVEKLTADDDGRDRRQVGVVAASGRSATFTGGGCLAWAGGRSGPNYAVQGNILAGPEVVAAMERAFLAGKGDLAERLHAALVAGDAQGGDSRGRQSAALYVARPGGGYSGFDDRYIDIRVDDHQDPIAELGRLLGIAMVNGRWNRAWGAFMQERHADALPVMEETLALAEKHGSAVLPEVLYDLAVIRAAAGRTAGAMAALKRALALNPKLVDAARGDHDLDRLRAESGFAALVPPAPAAPATPTAATPGPGK